MNKRQFAKLEALLKEHDYRMYDQHWHHEDYVWGKSFHKSDNQWEEGRAAYQILISVYNWSNPDKDIYTRLPADMRDRVGLEVHIDMSRTIDERLELVFAWHGNDTIEQIEYVAEQYYNAMCTIFKKPREEKPTTEL